MNELFTVRTPSDACARLLCTLSPLPDRETIRLAAALGRVIAEPIVSTQTLPAFARATMDGYAVIGRETFGASETAPAYLRLAGESRMGEPPGAPIAPGTAVRIHTGAALPPGADAVAIVEETNDRGGEIEFLRPATPGEHVVAIGEDVRAGEPVIAAGTRLRAAELGALAALGIDEIAVRRRPRVAILSTGDEVVPVAAQPALGQVRDVNAVTIGASVQDAGGEPLDGGIVGDDEEALVARATSLLARADALVLSAGSSVSHRDLTARAIERLGAPGILVHGVALRPGKPTILASAGGKPVIGLPGNPVSALVCAWRFVRPMVRALAGEAVADDGLDDANALRARLRENIPSRPGREDYVPVRLERGEDGTLAAMPLFAKSNLIFAILPADGFALVPLDDGGLPAGSETLVVAR